MGAQVMMPDEVEVPICGPGTNPFDPRRQYGDRPGYDYPDPGPGTCVPEGWRGGPIDVTTPSSVRVKPSETGRVQGLDPWGRPFDSGASTNAFGHYGD